MHVTPTSKRFRIRCWWPSTLVIFHSAMGSDGNNHDTQEVIHADRNDWPRKNGCQHGAASAKRKAPVCGLQQIAKAREGGGSRGSRRIRLANGFCKKAGEAPNDLPNGAGSCCGPEYCRTPAASRGRRHSH